MSISFKTGDPLLTKKKIVKKDSLFTKLLEFSSGHPNSIPPERDFIPVL